MEMIDFTERQLEIMNVSAELIATEGLGGLTTKRIAERMGFSEAAIYRHFENKEKIVESLFLYIIQSVEGRLKGIVDKQDVSSDEKLRLWIEGQIAFVKSHQHFMMSVFAEDWRMGSNEKMGAQLKMMQTVRGYLLRIIQEGQERNVFRKGGKPEYMVHMFMGSFRLMVMSWKVSGGSFDLSQKANELLETILYLFKTQNNEN